MSNNKHYPTHPGAEHPPTMCMEIPVEEYESIKRENAELKAQLRNTQRALWLARSFIMTLLQRDFQRLAYQCNSTEYKKNLLEKRNRFYDLSVKFSAKAKEYE